MEPLLPEVTMIDQGQWPGGIVCVLNDTGSCPALFYKACVCMKMSERMYKRIGEEKANGEGTGLQERTEKDSW